MNKKFIETFWSGASQIVSSKLLNLWQVDYSKSIRDIQQYKQYKWLKYALELEANGKFILTDDSAGITASTIVIGALPQPETSMQINIDKAEGTFKTIYSINQVNKLITIDNRGYQVIRTGEGINFNTAFINEEIPSFQLDLPWRYLSTFISENNLEEMGVSYGDILRIKVELENRVAYLNCRILGINKNKIGFIFGLDTPVSGSSYKKISQDNIISLLKGFNIEFRLDLANNLIYENILLQLKNELNSLDWKRKTFEKELNSITVLNKELKLSVDKIIRLSKIKIQPEIKSILSLQEYIEQPETYKLNNKVYRQDNNVEIQEPIFIKDNKDFFISSDSGYLFYTNLIKNSNQVIIPFANLIELNFNFGDALEISNGLNKGKYIISKVIDKDKILLTSNIKESEVNRAVKITRRLNSNWLMFKPKLKDTIPTKLWAEQTYIDHNPKIEENFGNLVNFTLKDHKQFNLPIPYKMIVSSLMYSYSRGSQLDTIKLGATAILGLPFTYHAGYIIEIDPTYQLNEVDGSPLYGRIVIEYEEYREKKQNIYYYPRGKQIFVNGKWEDVNKELSGIAINPKTGKQYIVNDYIDIYQPLCKGIEVLDFKTKSDWINQLYAGGNSSIHITKYHNGHLRANTDLYGTQALILVKQFINQIKPKYTFIDIYAFKGVKDQITVTDKKHLKINMNFWDSVFTVPPVLKSYKDLPTYININGLTCVRYLTGTCFTQNGSSNISVDGGLISPRIRESHDSPYIRSGDLFIIRGKENLYPITQIVSDTELIISGNIQEGEYKYAIYRPQKNPIMAGSITLTSGQNTVTIPGIFSSGAQKSDNIVFWKNNEQSQNYSLSTLTTLNKNIIENGQWNYTIYRTKFLEEKQEDLEITIGATNWAQLITTKEIIVNVGDSIVIENIPYKVLDWRPSNLTVFLESLPAQATYDCYIKRKKWHPITNKDYYVSDKVEIKIKSPSTCECTDNDDEIEVQAPIDLTTCGVRAGWFIEFLNGPNRVDIGFGLGYWPIYQIIDNTHLKITRTSLGTGDYDYNFVNLV